MKGKDPHKSIYRTNQTIHAIRRAKERFNLDLTSEDIKEIISLIQKRQAVQVSLDFLSDRNTFKLKYKDKEIYAVYNKKFQSIHTFYTKQMVDENSLDL